MSEEKRHRSKVAVIGSGLAGLTVAYLLHNDPRQRYEVVVFESSCQLSLDSASVDIDPRWPGGKRCRVDVPMRAFTGGYYRHLMSLYDHLGIRYHWQKFCFEFWKHEDFQSQSKGPYFVHASDNHECPPPRPRGKSVVDHVAEVVFVIFWFFWFMTCCQIIRPRSNETFDAYLRRNWMPRMFISRYLLPLISAIATCSHQEILEFPASDVVVYRKLIRRQTQYVVTGGVRRVQEALIPGLDIRLGTRVIDIQAASGVIEITSESIQEDGQNAQAVATFDQVITAVPPNVVAAMFEPARSQLSRIPVRTLETIVHRTPAEHRPPASKHGAEHILLKTSAFAGGWTEASHTRADGIAVTSCPILPFPEAYEILARASFIRTLRTLESRQIVANALRTGTPSERTYYESKSWRNGDQGVWVVGAWCFDGMVLLEGAVASAIHVAKAFGVEIPWE